MFQILWKNFQALTILQLLICRGVANFGMWCTLAVCREKQHLDEREAMQREHIANEQKYSQAVRELQAKV